MYKAQGAMSMMGKINKQRQAKGGQFTQKSSQQNRRSIISRTSGAAHQISKDYVKNTSSDKLPHGYLPPKIPKKDLNIAI